MHTRMTASKINASNGTSDNVSNRRLVDTPGSFAVSFKFVTVVCIKVDVVAMLPCYIQVTFVRSIGLYDSQSLAVSCVRKRLVVKKHVCDSSVATHHFRLRGEFSLGTLGKH